MALSDDVKQAELALIDILDELKNARGKLASIEVDHTIEVADARNEAGKPIFTNDKARDAARERMCAEDENYQETYRSVRKLDREAKIAEATLNKLKMDFKLHLLDREEHIRRMDAMFLREELRRLVAANVEVDVTKVPF